MKIIRLMASNVKRITAVEIDADGKSVVEISGRNAQGKSSVLDSIAMALGGRAVQPPRPIRDGATRGEVVLELDGGLEVRRTLTPSGGSLTVTDSTGTVRSPQTLLDRLWGSQARDPLVFARAPRREQAELLRVMTGLDFADLNRRREALYQQRTTVSLAARAARARAEGIQTHADVPAQESDTTSLLAELDRRREVNQQNARHRDETRSMLRDLELRQAYIARLEQDLAAARVAAEEAKSELRKMESVKLIDLDEDSIRRDLAGAAEINRKISDNKRSQEATDEAEDAETRAAELTLDIEAIDAEKAAALDAAEMPIAGLAFSADGVTYHGVPLEQCSQAEQIRISVAVCLHGNPEIRVLLIREGSLLDDDGLASLASAAESHGAQVWVERVTPSGPCAIVIENGAVVSARKEDI